MPWLRRSPRDITREQCLNCGEQIVGLYCHQCGQFVGEHNKGLWPFIAEFLDEFIKVDSKFLRTIIPLIIKPGFLTRQWVLGKRVRYITPLKLYISLSALCFLVVSLTTHPEIAHIDAKDSTQIDAARAQLTKQEQKSMSPFERTLVEPWKRLMVGGPEGARLAKEFSDKFMSRLSTANLILLPIFALLFKILYVRRSKYYVEHLVFALHYYAFFSIGTTLILLIGKLKPLGFGQVSISLGLLDIPIVLWMLAYLPIAMFVNYQQGIIKTLFKCWIFCSVYMIAIGIVLTGTLYYTVYELPEAPASDSLQKPVAKPTGQAPPVKQLGAKPGK